MIGLTVNAGDNFKNWAAIPLAPCRCHCAKLPQPTLSNEPVVEQGTPKGTLIQLVYWIIRGIQTGSHFETDKATRRLDR